MFGGVEKPAVGSSYLARKGGHDSLYDRNTNLTYSKAQGRLGTIGEWEQMLKTNPIARIAYTSMIATLQSATFHIGIPEQANEKDVNPEVKQFVNDLLFVKPDKRFSQYVGRLLRAIAYGFYPQEITTKLEDGKLYIADLDPRPPRTFEPTTIKREADGWVRAQQQFYDEKDELKTVNYGAPGEGGKGWLWWPVYGDGLFGDPILRPVFNEHKEKEDIRRIRRLAVQKFLCPTPVVTSREDAGQDDEKAHKDEVEDTEKAIGSVVYDEEGVLTLPPWVESLTQFIPPGDAIAASIEAENHCDIQILLAFFAQWVARGLLAAYGSAGASGVDTQEQRNIRKHFVEWIKDQVQILIDYFVDWNYGPQLVYPELAVIYREELTLRDEVAAASQLMRGGGLDIDDLLRAYFRRQFNWPAEGPDHKPAISKGQPESQPGNEPDQPDERTPENRSEEREKVIKK
jgi:hypothetical protein